MMKIYVAGPVTGEGRRKLPDWVAKCYESVRAMRNEDDVQLELMLPESELTLDRATPSDFHRQISARISSANGVITIHSDDDASAAVESCLASVYLKKQLILTADEKKVPRLLRGQAGVMAVVECNKWTDPGFAMRQFVESLK